MSINCLIFLLLLHCTHNLRLPSNIWQIIPAHNSYTHDQSVRGLPNQTKVKTVWTDFGLTKLKGRSSATLYHSYLFLNLLLSNQQRFEVYLYEDKKLRNYLKLAIHINVRLKEEFPFFNKTAHTTYALYKDNIKVKENKDYLSQPHIYFNNQLLTITEANGDKIIISMREEPFYFIVFILIMALHFAFKIIVLVAPPNEYPSGPCPYLLLGWEIQFHLMMGDLVYQINNLMQFLLGISIVGISLCIFIRISIFVLTDDSKFIISRWILFFFGCFHGYAISMELSFFLYSLILLIQRREEYLQDIREKISKKYLLYYLCNIVFILYVKGCPHNAFRAQVNYYFCTFILVVVVLQIIMPQGSIIRYFSTLKYRQIKTGRKATDTYKTIWSHLFWKNYILKCPICSDFLNKNNSGFPDYQDSESFRVMKCVIQTGCNHFFHVKCLQNKLKRSLKCPLDGKSIPAVEF